MAAWIKMPLGMELGLSPGNFVLDGDPALPSPKREAEPLPNFRPMPIVAKLSPISTTTELLFTVYIGIAIE